MPSPSAAATLARLQILVDTKAVVEFLPHVADMETTCTCPGMRATVKSVRLEDEYGPSEDDQVFVIEYDFKGFEDFNRPFEVKDHYTDVPGVFVTAREAGNYVEEDELFVAGGKDADSFFTVLSVEAVERSTRIRAKHKEFGGDTSYTTWLEAQLEGALREVFASDAVAVDNKECVIADLDDWQGLYIDGVLFESDHKISALNMAHHLGHSCVRREVDGDWYEQEGDMPANLEDVKFR